MDPLDKYFQNGRYVCIHCDKGFPKRHQVNLPGEKLENAKIITFKNVPSLRCDALWARREKNIEKIAIQLFTVLRARLRVKRENE